MIDVYEWFPFKDVEPIENKYYIYINKQPFKIINIDNTVIPNTCPYSYMTRIYSKGYLELISPDKIDSILAEIKAEAL